LFISTM